MPAPLPKTISRPFRSHTKERAQHRTSATTPSVASSPSMAVKVNDSPLSPSPISRPPPSESSRSIATGLANSGHIMGDNSVGVVAPPLHSTPVKSARRSTATISITRSPITPSPVARHSSMTKPPSLGQIALNNTLAHSRRSRDVRSIIKSDQEDPMHDLSLGFPPPIAPRSHLCSPASNDDWFDSHFEGSMLNRIGSDEDGKDDEDGNDGEAEAEHEDGDGGEAEDNNTDSENGDSCSAADRSYIEKTSFSSLSAANRSYSEVVADLCNTRDLMRRANDLQDECTRLQKMVDERNEAIENSIKTIEHLAAQRDHFKARAMGVETVTVAVEPPVLGSGAYKQCVVEKNQYEALALERDLYKALAQGADVVCAERDRYKALALTADTVRTQRDQYLALASAMTIERDTYKQMVKTGYKHIKAKAARVAEASLKWESGCACQRYALGRGDECPHVESEGGD